MEVELDHYWNMPDEHVWEALTVSYARTRAAAEIPPGSPRSAAD